MENNKVDIILPSFNLKEIQRSVIEYILKQNPEITYIEVAKLLGISERSLYRFFRSEKMPNITKVSREYQRYLKLKEKYEETTHL